MEENAVLSSAHLMEEYTIPCCESIDFSFSFSASRALYLMTSALYFFAAIIKPIASYCPMITNMIVRIRSKFPINAPAFLIFSQDCVSPT